VALHFYEVYGLPSVARMPWVFQAPSLVILISATVSQSAVPLSFPYNPAHKKTQGLQKPFVPYIMRRQKVHAGIYASQVIWGVQHVVSELPGAPGCYSI
jgi:hypothetical protein